MDPRICQDMFSISLLIHIACHLEIDADDKKKEFLVEQGRSYTFMVGFVYMVGTDHDTSHADFGFSSDYPASHDPFGVLMNGVTISGETFSPSVPDVSQLPNMMQIGTYSAVITFPSDQTIFDALIALGRVGSANVNPNFGGILAYNQGVTT